ncbi:hypothetical protein BES34_003750 [Leptospira inadai serovar Lyme]|uniref:Uncharacterized protein n=1 Tax=Leptospira inadai serovar Lyme TaxID=293084 RepID=A0ABX4YLI0_9LEPT|nr:hypothetical protein BES34_003750 [Leptospira inadai serovar Lyme]
MPLAEDRCVRFAHARQKLLDVRKTAGVEQRSTVTQESFSIAWKLHLSMFCPQSSVFRPLNSRCIRPTSVL